jgi:hypothetical protein
MSLLDQVLATMTQEVKLFAIARKRSALFQARVGGCPYSPSSYGTKLASYPVGTLQKAAGVPIWGVK